MTDEKYTFVETIKERKALVPSSTKKPRKNICTLPSDYLTTKEKRALNSKVTTMKFNHRYTWKELKGFPSDLQKEYFTRIFTLYRVTGLEVTKMLQVNPTYIHTIFNRLGLTIKGLRLSAKEYWDFATFGDNVDTSPREKAELALPALSPTATVTCMTISIKAQTWEELYEACKGFPFPTSEINFKIERGNI